MPSRKPRIALTVPDEINNTLDRMADLTGVPKTKLIIEMLEEYVPILERAVVLLEQIHADKENAAEIARKYAQELILDTNDKLGVIAREAKDL